MSAKEFAFVEVDISGRVTDKSHLHTIRKHIMKDIGKARRKAIPSSAEPKSKARNLRYGKSYKSRGCESIIPSPRAGPLGSGRMDPFQSYPVPVDMELLFLIDHLHTCSDSHLRPFKDTWYPISVSDPAFFYEILSNVSAYVFALRNGNKNTNECPQSIALHLRAISSLRARLLDPVLGISDGIIGTVLAFASFSHRTNDWAEYDFHMAALYRIIQARGGLSCLSPNPVLRHLISGVDLAGTCFLEKPKPLFPLPTTTSRGSASKSMPWPVPQTPYPSQSIWKHAFQTKSPLLSVFHDITTFIMILKSDLTLNDRSLSVDQYTIRTMIKRLEELPKTDSGITEDNLTEECCRLAALLLLEQISSHFGAPGSGASSLNEGHSHNTTMNVQELHNILVVDSFYKKWLLFKPLLNWVACLAAVSTSNEEIQHDFLQVIVYAGKLMGLNSWDEALITAANMLWVGEVFDGKYHSVTKSVSWKKHQ
ncbi:hypothetical protein L207DRAFT_206820 [Hyaloscypha variabilis F]|uniref:Tachykinin family protein n=1 Tax=Hyaloscypha variabilis (strain UAMH 11265 / GT02V1 / F) TaxID=1149755 RepID=A0A2J6S5Z7_HYAVF|nr:hypothetical protein L207DRAFT_206820 [Hyaloscypha variabilis F]